jgi:hypothetical protein
VLNELKVYFVFFTIENWMKFPEISLKSNMIGPDRSEKDNFLYLQTFPLPAQILVMFSIKVKNHECTFSDILFDFFY